MGKVNSLLTERLKLATEKFSKMTNLAEMSSSGQLSSFSGVFRVGTLTPNEQNSLREILKSFCDDNQEIEIDLEALFSLTSEVKAINNQAAILHGERIKKAQEILKRYRDGAFTAWLIATYGNRQTPYNFLQYYELYLLLPQLLHSKLDEMPRQAVYTLASRAGPLESKTDIIKNYKGEPKQELLNLIRQTFPLPSDDKRSQDLAAFAINNLNKLLKVVDQPTFKPTPRQKKMLHNLLSSFKKISS
jgi:hypothetical protein